MTDELEERHNRAMAQAEQADDVRRRGDAGRAGELFRDAFVLEREVALRYEAIPGASSATVAILFQSAASLALEAGELREAERLIARALSGEPPAALAEELRELWDRLRPQLRSLQAA